MTKFGKCHKTTFTTGAEKKSDINFLIYFYIQIITDIFRENLKNSKVTIYVSGLSAKSRGYDEKLLEGYNAEFAIPDVLVDESIKADSIFCY